MNIQFYPKGSPIFDGLDSSLHAWYIDADTSEYLELVEWLKSMTFEGRVVWEPAYVGNGPCSSKLTLQIVAHLDRDAALIRLHL